MTEPIRISPHILLLEQQFDDELARPRVRADREPALRIAAARWSSATWTAAEAAGPLEVGEAEVSRGLDVASRPIFVCGAHRSGTTLVRDLLDGHPSLAVLPSEGTFFTNFERRLERLQPQSWLPFLGQEWLRRLANPIHQHPYWLLGRSSQESSPYVSFARALMAWWPFVRKRFGNVASSWPLAAIALAYGHCTTGFSKSSNLRRWAEKTPTNERFAHRLRAEFPGARFVHVVRHPFSVYASHKRAAQNAGERFQNSNQIMADLNRSYRMAAEQSRSGPTNDCLLIRYEDLIDGAPGMVDRLADFLDIESLPILLQPTAAGLPTVSNSSFAMDVAAGRVHCMDHRQWIDTLTRPDRERVAAVVGDAAASIGYALVPIAPARARLIRLSVLIAGRFQ